MCKSKASDNQIVCFLFCFFVLSGTKKHESIHFHLNFGRNTKKPAGKAGKDLYLHIRRLPSTNSASLPSKEPELLVLMIPRHVWTPFPSATRPKLPKTTGLSQIVKNNCSFFRGKAFHLLFVTAFHLTTVLKKYRQWLCPFSSQNPCIFDRLYPLSSCTTVAYFSFILPLDVRVFFFFCRRGLRY